MDQLDAPADSAVNTEGPGFILEDTRFDLLENKVALASRGLITYGSNVKEVTTQVSEGTMDCGIIYATDAFSADLTVAVSFPLMYRTARGTFESFDETLAQAGRTLGIRSVHPAEPKEVNTLPCWRRRVTGSWTESSSRAAARTAPRSLTRPEHKNAS